MEISDLKLFHYIVGTFVLFSGVAALSFRKGSPPHRLAGNIFFVSMLLVAANGMHLAFLKTDVGFPLRMWTATLGGFAFYLVFSSWMTVKREEGKSGLIEIGAFLIILAASANLFYLGLTVGANTSGATAGDVALPPLAYYIVAGLGAFFAALDLTVIMRGGISGKQRIARHLWRMCFSFFIAVTILFFANDQVFPEALRRSNVLSAPPIIVLAILLFWLPRVLFTRWYEKA